MLCIRASTSPANANFLCSAGPVGRLGYALARSAAGSAMIACLGVRALHACHRRDYQARWITVVCHCRLVHDDILVLIEVDAILG